MGLKIYLLLLALVGVGRLLELRRSRSNQQVLRARGIAMARDPGFRWMVALHTGVLLGSAVEVAVARRPFVPRVALPAGVVLVGANLLRWWVIRTLAGHWNVRVMDSLGLGVVSEGPFRWVRHPNYVAVFLELAAIPLLHSAWLTALLGSTLHVLVLRQRLAVEEPILLENPTYRAEMAWKPSFVPSPFARRPLAAADA
jgi:methyltransferase